MRYLAAYLLAVLGGNENPSEDDIKRILSSVGIEVDSALLKRVVTELRGKDIEELIAEGRQKLATMPGAGGAVYSGSVSTTAAAVVAEAPKEEKKAEAKKEESEPESDEDMGFGLFD